MSVKNNRKLIAGNHFIIKGRRQIGQYINFYTWITLGVLAILIPLY